MAGLDLAGVQRIYLDANTWDLVASHPASALIAAGLSEPSSRVALVSMVTAVELLRTPEPKRGLLLGVVSSPLRATAVLLPFPTVLLEQFALASRAGSDSASITEDETARTLRAMLMDPGLINDVDLGTMTTWAADQKLGFKRFMNEVRASNHRSTSLRMTKDFLQDDGLAAMLVGYLPSLGLKKVDVRHLFDRSPAWAALGAQVAVSIEIANRTGRVGELAGGPDLLQVPYLGSVNTFVSNDQGFLAAARRVAEILEGHLGYQVEVSAAVDFFASLGSPHPDL